MHEQIRQRVAVEHLEKCAQGLLQDADQGAGRDNGAVQIAFFEALDHGQVFFGISHHFTNVDLLKIDWKTLFA